MMSVSKAEIIKQLPTLSKRDRREIARLISEIEDDQSILAGSDRRANERFLMLDQVETKRGRTKLWFSTLTQSPGSRLGDDLRSP
jgi:hypothetical protein